MKNNGTLRISRPRIEIIGDKARVVASIESPEHGGARDVWLEVDRKYEEGLCYERGDAFLVGMLRYAMACGYDIESEAPISEELLYGLRTYLIPSLANHNEDIYEVRISASQDGTFLPNQGGVATGASLGIDSMFTIMHHVNSEYPSHNLTHLLLNNVGAYDPTRGGGGQYSWKIQRARSFSSEMGLPLVECNSNLAAAFVYNCRRFDQTNTYANAFAALCLQKLLRAYYYSSWGHDFSYFAIDNLDVHDSAAYDLLSFTAFSTRTLRFHPDGGAVSRFVKTQDVSQFAPAHRYLHVCTDDTGPNCGLCAKCRRTLITLDAIGALDEFSNVFDISAYRRNRTSNLRWWLMEQHMFGKNTYTGEATEILKPQMGLLDFSWVAYRLFRHRVAAMLGRGKFRG